MDTNNIMDSNNNKKILPNFNKNYSMAFIFSKLGGFFKRFFQIDAPILVLLKYKWQNKIILCILATPRDHLPQKTHFKCNYTFRFCSPSQRDPT